MIRITDKSLCCGCTACRSICPVGAISMQKDELGFRYPSVDANVCIDCGLCESVCGFSQKADGQVCQLENLSVYAACHEDCEIVSESRSGGVFTSLSDMILDQGGVVYGAAFDKDFSVKHIRAVSREDRNRMRGSKYVQSYLNDAFSQVKSDLESGRSVLFTGTPCQVAGLKSYIPASLQERLLTVDFVCHGTPSPAVWNDYLKYRSKDVDFNEVQFRDKQSCGWKAHVESFKDRNNEKKLYRTYSMMFYTETMHRDSCYVCPYNIQQRCSDITISDFWGIDQISQMFEVSSGVSMIVCRTDKGIKAFESAKPSLRVQKHLIDKEFMLKYNPNLLRATICPDDRSDFIEAYRNYGFDYVARRWGDVGFRYKVKKFITKVKGKLGIR